MRLKPFLIFILTIMLCQSFVSHTEAGWYLRPRAGLSMNVDEGDSQATVGAALGYEFIESVAAVDVGYSRIFSDPDTDLIEATGRVGVPLIPIYGVLGMGFFQTDTPASDWESAFRVGAGIKVPFIPIVDVSGEFTYLNLGGDTHLFEPIVSVGIGF